MGGCVISLGGCKVFLRPIESSGKTLSLTLKLQVARGSNFALGYNKTQRPWRLPLILSLVLSLILGPILSLVLSLTLKERICVGLLSFPHEAPVDFPIALTP